MSRPKYYSSLVIFFHDLLLLLYTGCCLLSVGHFTREQEENAFEISPFLCLLLLTSKHVQTTVRVCTSIQTTQRVYIQLQYVMLNDVVAGLRFRRFRLNSQNMYIKSSVFLFFFFSYCCCVTQSILLLHFALSLRVRVYNAPRETICIKNGQYILHTHTWICIVFSLANSPLRERAKRREISSFQWKEKKNPQERKKKNLQRNEIFHFIWSVRWEPEVYKAVKHWALYIYTSSAHTRPRKQVKEKEAISQL